MGRRPQIHAGYLLRGLVKYRHRVCRHLLCGFPLSHHVPFGVLHLYFQPVSPTLTGIVPYLCTDTHVGRTPLPCLQRRSCHERTVPVDMDRMFLHQTYIAVNPAAEYMFTSPRSQVCPPQIVHTHGNLILTSFHVWRNTNAETRVSAPMRTRQRAVDIHFGLLEHSVELQKQIPLQVVFRQIQHLAVPTVSGVELARKEIRNTERMRQSDAFPSGIVIVRPLCPKEIPALVCPLTVQVHYFSSFGGCHAATQANRAPHQQ